MTVFRGSFEIYLREKGLEELFSRLIQLGFSKPCLIVDSAIVNDIYFLRLKDNFGKKFPEMYVYELQIIEEPTYIFLDNCVSKLKLLDFDFLVGVGGGSLLDTTKGISILLKNSFSGINFRGIHKVSEPGIPTLLVPTTAGTGSEMTWTASFIDTENNLKLGINGDNVFAKFSLLVPELLINCPKSVLISAALDSIVHATEAISSPMSNPFTDSIAANAIKLITENIISAIEKKDLEKLHLLQIGSSEAGLAMLNSSGGPASGISYPLGVEYKVPHGFAGGIILPLIIKWNLQRGYSGYRAIDSVLSTESFIESLEYIYERLKVPSDFKAWGFKTIEDVQKITEKTLSERGENLRLNPIKFERENLFDFLRQLI